jgi:hypothetical protein
MLSEPCNALQSLFLPMPCMVAVTITGVGSQRSTAQGLTRSTSNLVNLRRRAK